MPQPPQVEAQEDGKDKPDLTLPEPAGKGLNFKLDELGLAGTIAAAIGGGLGVLGFVAFFGAAILWVRLDEASLPANEALAVMPRSVLISTGASFVAPALFAALGVTLILYLADGAARGVQRRVLGKEQLQEFNEISAKKKAKLEDVEALRALSLATKPRDASSQTSEAIRNDLRDAQAQLDQVEGEEVSKKETLEAAASASNRYKRAEKARRRIPIGAVIVLFLLGSFLLSICLLSLGSGSLMVFAAAVLTVGCVMLRRATDRFAWFALATFVATCVLASLLTYLRTVEHPKVSPVALLRTDGPPAYGIYVAQTSDRVYLGTKPTLNGAARLSSFKRDEVLQVVVGSLQRPTEAEERAIAFARRLCVQAQERPVDGKLVAAEKGGEAAEEVASGCTDDDLDDLDIYIASRRAADEAQQARAD